MGMRFCSQHHQLSIDGTYKVPWTLVHVAIPIPPKSLFSGLLVLSLEPTYILHIYIDAANGIICRLSWEF